jgi:hypothetical protein
MSDTNQPLQVTQNINDWLSRSGLSVADLDRMTPHQQADVGRQWQGYQADVRTFQANSGISSAQLPNYSMVSVHAVPRIDSPVPQKQERLTFDEWSRRGREAIEKHAGRG